VIFERKPPWLKTPVPRAAPLRRMEGLLRERDLHTVCEAALCPNLGTCFAQGTATFLIMGDVCTRACGFCGVDHGMPGPLDPAEPGQVADAAARLRLRHVVVTSVSRDDLPDAGAAHYVATLRAVRSRSPEASVEVLVPDFGGRQESAQLVLGETPEVFNHNVETVARLYPVVRPQADYQRSLGVLRSAADRGTSVVKTGCMVGLGETEAEMRALFHEVAAIGVQVLTIGQYLQPTRANLPVVEYVAPDTFDCYREWGEALGLQVHAAPLVRSSFQARESYVQAGTRAANPW
jgi:lipoic acid synthetase